jgi:hypothetical protein
MSLKRDIIRHYKSAWRNEYQELKWKRGPVSELPADFCVLEGEPGPVHEMWIYATCCMSQPGDEYKLEIHLFAPEATMSHVELLTVIAHYHRTGVSLRIGDTVNFGRPWIPGSKCEFGLLSRPYLDGPEFEQRETKFGVINCSWLIPITREEREFKKAKGLEALEELFEGKGVNYLDPNRDSLV